MANPLLQGTVIQKATETQVFLQDFGLLLVEIKAVFIGEIHVGYSITTMEKLVKVLAGDARQDGLFFLLTQFILALKGEVFSLQSDKCQVKKN